MRIVHVVRSRLPAAAYGGIERVVWWLAKEQSAGGHEVVLLADAGSECPFAAVVLRDPHLPIEGQIPADADVVHFHNPYRGPLERPYLVTVHGNPRVGEISDRNAVFISRDHAIRNGSDVFVYNGLDPEAYGNPRLEWTRGYFHFLGKAAWRVKNVRGAIRVARKAGLPLTVLGGRRLNVHMGFRFTPDRNVSFAGMVGGELKNRLLASSRGLIFPVLWPEPFGLAVVESLYFGCPVLATPYGALPELVPPDVGLLSASSDELADAARGIDAFSRRRCHEWVMDRFTARTMAAEYLKLYERVVSGEILNRQAPLARPFPPCVFD
jgi:glycosyltransferase involved in cell wall biosynthesis